MPSVTVLLYETNSGNLIIWSEDYKRGYCGLEQLVGDRFSDIAYELSVGTDDYRLPRCQKEPVAGIPTRLIAYWDGCEVTQVENPGVAGRLMLSREIFVAIDGKGK